jgi:tetratricopeptide (TPR) repeat protein
MNVSTVANQRKRLGMSAHQPATNNAAQSLTVLSALAILFLAVYAFPVSQHRRSESQKPAREQADSPLEALERDIAGGNFKGTEARLTAYLKAHPDSWRARYDLGYVQFRIHEIGSSIKELSRSLELNPQNAEAHKILGLDCSIIGRYDLAEVELLQAAQLKPESAEMHYFLARTYYTRGVYPLAESEFEMAIRLDPSYTKAYSNLGITQEALGDNDAAQLNYIKAIRLSERRQKERSEWPYIYLSGFYNRQEKPTEALSYARQGLGVNPKSDAAHFEMAKAYRSQGEWQQALDAVRRAISINPQVADYYYVLGLMLRKLGDERASEEALAKYAQLKNPAGDVGQGAPQHNALEPLGPPEFP